MKSPSGHTFGLCQLCGEHHDSTAFCMPKEVKEVTDKALLDEVSKTLDLTDFSTDPTKERSKENE